MYEFGEELTKEDHDLIEKVYKAVSLKPGLFVNLMYACYGAFNKRVEFAEKRAADAEAVAVCAVAMAGKKATPSMKKWCEDMFSGYLLDHTTSFNWKNCKDDIDNALVKTFGEEGGNSNG